MTLDGHIRFVELMSQSGERIALNPAAIWHVRPAGNETAIYSASGAVLFVKDSYENVLKALQTT